MKKEKNKKSDIQTQIRELISTHPYKYADIIDLTQRLWKCEAALQEYSDTLSYGNGFPLLGWIIDPPDDLKEYGHHISALDSPKDFIEFKTELSNSEDPKDFVKINMYMPTLKEHKSPENILSYISTLRKKKIQERQIIEHCINCCEYLIDLLDKKMTDNEKDQYFFYLHYVPARSYEALGYWTRKLEEMKVAKKGRDTQKENEEMKENAVKQAYIKLVNEHATSAQKKSFSNQSKNKMASHVQEFAIEALKNRKTSKGELVLKRKLDKKGTTQYSGLSIDTVINILDKQEFKVYPWKKKSRTK